MADSRCGVTRGRQGDRSISGSPVRELVEEIVVMGHQIEEHHLRATNRRI